VSSLRRVLIVVNPAYSDPTQTQSGIRLNRSHPRGYPSCRLPRSSRRASHRRETRVRRQAHSRSQLSQAQLREADNRSPSVASSCRDQTVHRHPCLSLLTVPRRGTGAWTERSSSECYPCSSSDPGSHQGNHLRRRSTRGYPEGTAARAFQPCSGSPGWSRPRPTPTAAVSISTRLGQVGSEHPCEFRKDPDCFVVDLAATSSRRTH